MIVEKIMENKTKRIKQYPVHSNRASSLGHECIRYLVLERTRWREKSLHDVGLQAIFDEGKLHEKAVLREIEEAGFDVIEQERPFEWKEHNITGHIDGKVLLGEAVPLEIKSCSDWQFNSFSNIDSLINHRSPWVRRYPAQLSLYLLMDNKEWGLFIFKNKQTGQFKEIRLDLDYGLGEQLIQKADLVNQYVEAGGLPHHMPYDEDICGRCGYLAICLPEVKREALDLSTDPELEKMLNEWHGLKPEVATYNKLNKKIKAALKEHESIICGSFLITGKWCDRKGFTVAATKYWKTNIKKIED